MYWVSDVTGTRHDGPASVSYLQPMTQGGDTDDTPGRRFATLVRTARKAAGLTQEQLEERSGVTRQTIIRYESGRASGPEPEGVRAVCLALGIDPRRAAVALGFLTDEEVGGPPIPRFDPTIEEVIADLTDPAVSEEDKYALVRYLQFLRTERRSGGGSGNRRVG